MHQHVTHTVARRVAADSSAAAATGEASACIGGKDACIGTEADHARGAHLADDGRQARAGDAQEAVRVVPIWSV